MITDYDADLTTLVASAIKAITAGIAPHADKREQAEYTRNVPIWLRNRNGLPADEVASILAVEAPELGIETEDDLYQALNAGQWQRRNTHAASYRPAQPEGRKLAKAESKGFDPVAAANAVTQFALALQEIDSAALDQLRAAWKAAYPVSGHKALARYLVTGDLEAACSKLAKMAVN
jgi:hypothetical protein